MAAKRWSEYPADMVRKMALGQAIEAAAKPKRKRAKRSKSPFVPVPGKKFTPHQLHVLRQIAVLQRELGRAPSANDMAARLGMTRLGARRLLKALEAHGLACDVPITVSSGKWAVTEAGLAVLEEE